MSARSVSGGSSVAVDKREVLESRGRLLRLARRLRGEEPGGVRGLAMVEAMLSDGSSPLLRRRGEPESAPGAPARYLEAATAALEDGTSRPCN